MKQYLTNLYFILIFLVTFSQAKSQSCNADFDYKIIDDISSYTYGFINRSTADSLIIGYSWNFGDGSISKKINPEHQYFEEGDFLVSLTIFTSDSCSSTYSDTIHVQTVIPPGCMAYFTFIHLTQSVNYTYAFTDHSVSGTNDTITAWLWSFGDNSTSTAQNPIHQYLITGTFQVVLTIYTKNSCQATYTFNIVVSNGPVPCQASFTATPDTQANPLQYYFHDNSIHSTSIISWKWDFDDGDSSSLQDPIHVFPYSGIYYVRLKIITSGGCSDEISYPINVNNPQSYNLWGRVYAGPYVIDKCIAYLYKEYNNNYYKPIDTVRLTSINDTLGVYYFFQIPEGRYKVKVILPTLSQYSEDYAPTYYGNDVTWNNGTTIQLFQDIAQANVNMESTNKIPGNSFVSGHIISNNSQHPQAENIELLIYDSQGQLVDYCFTDQNEDFEFPDLSPGNYLVTGEETGLTADMINVYLGQNDTVSNLIITLNNKSITGFFLLKNEVEEHRFTVYPNPANDFIVINLDEHTISTNLNLRIYDLHGRLVNEQTLSSGFSTKSKINISQLPEGLYFIQLSDNLENKFTKVRFIKK